ncbi:TetR/AcrR family transcriptional regulator [Luteimicrobium sp. NPDC057192]|uniref:TetR/AcrR family transcriptional regulator n=1 Tax=Luteimicrobium sp. NPDC057192 TaxID=3346042 RepID=UPI0036437369
MTPPRARRTDPGRRDRIVDACLDVIATSGVAGTSHRAVAAAADVPLGSMTYHFAGMGELLREAFTRFATAQSDGFEAAMAAASNRDEARAAVVGLVTGDGGHRDLVLTHELYTLAARDPAFRDLTTAWMARSRRALERHFDPVTTRMLDALVEGLAMHRALDTDPDHAADATEAVRRITGWP